MNGFVKLSTTMLRKLNQNEAYLYALMTSFADFKTLVVKYKSRQRLAEELFGKATKKNMDTITKYIDHLEDLGLLTVKRVYNGANEYEITSLKSGYVEIYRTLFEVCHFLSVKAKGLLVQLATLAYKDTNRIDYTKKEIAEKLGISLPTLRGLWKELEENGFINGNVLNSEFVKGHEDLSSLKAYVSKYESEFEQMDKSSCFYKEYQWVLKNIDGSKTEKDILLYKKNRYDKIAMCLFNQNKEEKKEIVNITL